jgi:hypothetical protein
VVTRGGGATWQSLKNVRLNLAEQVVWTTVPAVPDRSDVQPLLGGDLLAVQHALARAQLPQPALEGGLVA